MCHDAMISGPTIPRFTETDSLRFRRGSQMSSVTELLKVRIASSFPEIHGSVLDCRRAFLVRRHRPVSSIECDVPGLPRDAALRCARCGR